MPDDCISADRHSPRSVHTSVHVPHVQVYGQFADSATNRLGSAAETSQEPDSSNKQAPGHLNPVEFQLQTAHGNYP